MQRMTNTPDVEDALEAFCYSCDCDMICDKCILGKIYDRLAELEDKLQSGILVDTTPYIVKLDGPVVFRYKVIKPTVHKRNVEMFIHQEGAEECLKKLSKEIK